MLTKEAFNALLKTLEEPPGHVKFIFCTTDPEKIPITVLSRCQRFDFAPVSSDEIVERLKFIVTSEGAEADEEALRVLARKASGSVRDSQSLLEQLMSFTSERITLDAVNSMLGTAGAARLHGVLQALADHDACRALSELDQAIGEGVDAGQLTEQLLGCVRDLLALSVGGGKELLLHSSESEIDLLSEIANKWGTSNLLAAAQIVDQALARMRLVTHSRVLLETALIRIAKLEDLQELSELISQIHSGTAPAPKKKTEPVSSPALPVSTPPSTPPSSVRIDPPQVPSPSSAPTKSGSVAATAAVATTVAVAASIPKTETKSKPSALPQTAAPAAKTNDNAIPEQLQNKTASEAAGSLDAKAIWQKTITQLDGLAADFASHFDDAANSAPNRLVVTFPPGYTSSKAFCERPDKQGEIEKIASEIAGRKLRIEFKVRAGEKQGAPPPRRAASARQRERDALQNLFVQRALEVFAGEVKGVSPPKQKRS